MKKIIIFIVISLLLFSLYPQDATSAQQSDLQTNFGLLGTLFKLERLRDEAVARIQKINRDIQENENTIRKSEDIIGRAKEKGNIQAETIARQALMNAQEAKRKNEISKSAFELRRRRAEEAYAGVRNMLAQRLGVKSQINGLVSNYSGRVDIFKKNGDKLSLDDSRGGYPPPAGYLEPGDEVWTYGNSKAEVQVWGGLGSVTLGKYSRFKVEEDSEGRQIINFLKGKAYIAVDKADDFAKMLREKLKAYKEDLRTIVEADEEERERALRMWMREFGRRFEVRTTTLAGTVRGTDFLVFLKDNNETELTVLKGSVELSDLQGKKKVIVDAGYKVTASKEGISEPQRIDLTKIERWWD